jgi:long-chain acyl-CoA synthetase
VTAAAMPDERAERDPFGACVADERGDLDNARFAETVLAVAAVLAAAGLGADDVLAIALPNRIEFVTCVFAAWRLGAAVTPIDPALSAREARDRIEDAAAALIVADEAAARKLGGAGRPIVALREVVAPPAPEAGVPISATPASLALLLYPDGTTGVMLDHGNLTQAADRIADWYKMDQDTACLVVLPLSGVDQLVLSVVAPLLAGGSTFIAGRFGADRFSADRLSADRLWATVERARPTYFVAGNGVCAALLARPAGPADTTSLRYVINAAEPMPPEVAAEFEWRHGVPVIDGFGPAECAGCCTANPPYGIRKPGTAGLPLPGVDVGVVDARGHLLPAGVTGEVIVRGSTVMRGYLGRPARTARALRGGWLRTGAAGRFDHDGYLMLARPHRARSAQPSR